jgi:spore maturation protein CgeB
LNVTRAEMILAGWSPSVRLFEAAACGVPIISDWWEGLDEIFEPDREILIARTSEDVLHYLRDISDADRRAIGARARKRVMREHTAAHRAAELERYVGEAIVRKTPTLIQIESDDLKGISPTVRRLIGVAPDVDAVAEYHQHLLEKYGR